MAAKRYKLRDLDGLRADSATVGKQRPEDPLAMDMAMMGGGRAEGVRDWIEDRTGIGPWSIRKIDRNNQALDHYPAPPADALMWVERLTIGLDAIYIGGKGAPRSPYSLITWWRHSDGRTRQIQQRMKTQTAIIDALNAAHGPREWR